MIYDNLIPKDKHEKLVAFLTWRDFPWYYQPNIAYKYDPNNHDPNAIESFGLTHAVWDTEIGKVSEALSYVEPIVDYFQRRSGLKINNFLRIKINLQTPIPNNQPHMYNGAHVDRYHDHKVLIYYPLDSDGDTFIFNEVFNNEKVETHPTRIVPTIKERISPVANRLLMLDTGLRYHSSSNPINYSQRYSININYN